MLREYAFHCFAMECILLEHCFLEYALVKNMHYIALQCNAYFQREYAFGRKRPLKICITMRSIVMHVFDEAYS